MVSASSVSMDPKKVEDVMSWDRPKSVFEIRSFLGLVISASSAYDEIDLEGGQVCVG